MDNGARVNWIPREAALVEELEHYLATGGAAALTIVAVTSEDHVPVAAGRYLIKVDAELALVPKGSWICRAWGEHRAQVRRLHCDQFKCHQVRLAGDAVWSAAEVVRSNTPHERDPSDEQLSDAPLEEIAVPGAVSNDALDDAQQFAQLRVVRAEDGLLQLANADPAEAHRLLLAAQQQLHRALDGL